jgi:hypothetical protein
MTSGFNDNENKCLCEAWLAASHDCKVYWAKVVQNYHERKLSQALRDEEPRMGESSR